MFGPGHRPAEQVRRPSWPALWLSVAGTAAAALLLSGAIGSIIGSSNSDSNTNSAAPTITVEAAAPQVNPTIPATPDPVCAEWAPISSSYAAKQAEWGKTDAKIPATDWGPEQMALNINIIGVLRDQAADMKLLASKATDPFLARLLREQALYEEEFANRLPNYQPSDQVLWQAAIDYASAVRATCLTVQPR